MTVFETLFRNAYEAAFGVRPVFSLSHLTDREVIARTASIEYGVKTRQFGS